MKFDIPAPKNLLRLICALALVTAFFACSSPQKQEPAPLGPALELFRMTYELGEIQRLCSEHLAEAEKRLTAIEELKKDQINIDSTLHAFEDALVDFYFKTEPLTFMASVSTDKKIVPEAVECREKQGQFAVAAYARKKIYDKFATLTPRTSEEARLHLKTKESFERSGIQLPALKLKKLTDLKKRLNKIETEFSTTLDQDTSTEKFKESELEGVPPEMKKRWKKDESGLFTVTTKTTDYISLMENCTNANTRKKMMAAFLRRGGQKNADRLQTAIQIRQEIAEIMSYPTWMDYRINDRTAKNMKTVREFLFGLRGKLSQRYQQDLQQLLDFKKSLNADAKAVDPWDVAFLTYQLKKKEYALDEEKVREYFPADRVVEGVFKVFSNLLGVEFRKVDNAMVWEKSVSLYSVHNAGSEDSIGYFFTDFHPREGKYGHAAAFSIFSGRRESSGKYNLPISAIVANFTPPTDTKPALMTHDEVETLFHEFGHIMHQVLTRAPYASLSGTAVPWDFVEAPSQMLENWAWDPEVLKKISSHYLRKGENLPEETVKKMISARHFQEGTSYMRQLVNSIYDLGLHSGERKVDVLESYYKTYRDLLSMEPLPGSLFPAAFGHLMGGYDAGYYGYLWSRVFAEDMFSEFKKSSLNNETLGKKYRSEILEVGNMRDAMESLERFLGRKASNEAFFSSIGIK